MLKMIATIFYIEFVLLLRRSQAWLYPIAFFLIVMTLFPLAFSPEPQFLQKYLPGCFWIAALFANLLSVQTLFITEKEEGTLEQCILSQIDLPILILVKLTAHWLIAQLPLILLTPAIGLLFNLDHATIWILSLSLLLGTPIITLIGALCAALTLNLHQQGTMLGLLILPLITPVLIFGVNITQQSQAGFQTLGPLAFLSSITIFAVALLPLAISTTLKITLDD